jgi:hypothetical protein
MSSVRETIGTQIVTDNPTYSVKTELASAPDNLSGTRVHVFRSALGKTNNGTLLSHECTIEVMIGKQNENELDTVLDNILLSLQRINELDWTSVNRRIFDEKYHGYEITCTAPSANVYRSAILQERA